MSRMLKFFRHFNEDAMIDPKAPFWLAIPVSMANSLALLGSDFIYDISRAREIYRRTYQYRRTILVSLFISVFALLAGGRQLIRAGAGSLMRSNSTLQHTALAALCFVIFVVSVAVFVITIQKCRELIAKSDKMLGKKLGYNAVRVAELLERRRSAHLTEISRTNNE